jgi:hypothetical protein
VILHGAVFHAHHHTFVWEITCPEDNEGFTGALAQTLSYVCLLLQGIVLKFPVINFNAISCKKYNLECNSFQ